METNTPESPVVIAGHLMSPVLIEQEAYSSANAQLVTLRRMVREKDQTINRQSLLDRQSQSEHQDPGVGHTGEDVTPQLQRGQGDGGVAESASPSLNMTNTSNRYQLSSSEHKIKEKGIY